MTKRRAKTIRIQIQDKPQQYEVVMDGYVYQFLGRVDSVEFSSKGIFVHLMADHHRVICRRTKGRKN